MNNLLTVPKAKEKEGPKTTKAKPIRRNLMQTSLMFGPELSCSQATPSSPSRIPLSSPIGSPVVVSLTSPVTASPSTPATPLLATQTRPCTLCRAQEWDGCAWECGSACFISLLTVWSFAGCFLLMIACFYPSSLAVALFKIDLVSVLCLRVLICSSCSLPPDSLTSLLFHLIPTHAFATDWSFFVSNRQRTPTHSRSFAIMRDSARLHTPSFSSLNVQCHSIALCHQYLSLRLLRTVFLRIGKILPSTNGRFSLSQPAIRSSSSSTACICLFTIASIPSRHYLLMNHQTGVITHSLASHSSVYHHRPFVIAFAPTVSVPVHIV
ncbi:hypothetical protein F4604DRAFT_1919664 [Suillus subluteus]|nr:hypothetical protein F4604DRAFT_1919664 [Suillus subluteus]